MATRKYKKIQSKTKKMKGSGNTTDSSKKKDLNKNKNNSKDVLDILESGEKSKHLLNLLERGALSDVLKMIQTPSSSIKPTKNTNNRTFKNFMNSIKDGNRRGPVNFGGSGKPTSKSNSSTCYKDQKEILKHIKTILTNEVKKMKNTNKSSPHQLEIARSLNEVKELEKINELLKKYNKKGGKIVRKTRKYKR